MSKSVSFSHKHYVIPLICYITWRESIAVRDCANGRHPLRVVEIQGLLLPEIRCRKRGSHAGDCRGPPYSSSKAQPVFPEDESTGPFKILFNEHVAQSNLKVVKTDPKFLAVTGKALSTDEKFFEVTVRLNPEYDPTIAGSRQYQTVNATQISKKTHKVTGNTTAKGAVTKTKVDLSTYTIVPYMSPHIGIISDQLVEETTEYFRNYNLNGITGTVTATPRKTAFTWWKRSRPRSAWAGIVSG